MAAPHREGTTQRTHDLACSGLVVGIRKFIGGTRHGVGAGVVVGLGFGCSRHGQQFGQSVVVNFHLKRLRGLWL